MEVARRPIPVPRLSLSHARLGRQLACPHPQLRTHTRVSVVAQTGRACYGARIVVVKVMLAVLAERAMCGRPPEGPLRDGSTPGRARGARALSVARRRLSVKGGGRVQGERHIRDLSTSNSAPGEDGSKPCSISQRAASRLRQDHQARITSRSTSVP